MTDEIAIDCPECGSFNSIKIAIIYPNNWAKILAFRCCECDNEWDGHSQRIRFMPLEQEETDDK